MDVEITPVFVHYMPDIELMQERMVYISREYKTCIHLCLCGCKEQTVTPLGNNWWTLTENDGKISLCPSIGNFQFSCKSHYYITNNVGRFC